MKKMTFILMAVMAVVFASCEKEGDDDNSTDYETLIIGTWKVTHAEFDGVFIDITVPPASEIISETTATFRTDGTYTGEGYLGDGSGTYEIKGNTVITYYAGEEFIKYEIISINGNECILIMRADDQSIKIKCKKIS